MGNCNFANNDYMPTSENASKFITVRQFKFIKVIGRGGFGRVWRVRNKLTDKIYAMKVMQKLKVFDKNSMICISNERKLLSKIKHPFIVNMSYAFQDRENLYLTLDYLTGGDLRYHLLQKTRFNEEQTKFIIACVILATEYLHYNNVIHRDLKPENLIFDKDGYISVTDLGVAKYFGEIQKELIDSSGTPGYMAPEVICGYPHSFTADYFSIGIILYEIIKGKV